MAKSNNPFAQLQLDRTQFQPVLEGMGATGYSYQKKGNAFHMCFELGGKQFLIEIYENGNGSTTLTRRGSIDQESFHSVATELVAACTNGNGANFSLAIPKFSDDHFTRLQEFLVAPEEEDGAGAILQSTAPSGGGDLYRYQGPQGHTLTLKRFPNGTLQAQGRRTCLVADVLDFMATVLPFEDAIKAQLETYDVNLTVAQVTTELDGLLPNACSRLHDVVRAQLASSLASTKVNMALPDYGLVAFPALRGLEGFLWHELQEAELDVRRARDFGEYFEAASPGQYVMRPEVAAYVGAERAAQFANCYSLYWRQRHSVFHADRTLDATRIVGSLNEARSIVAEVLKAIDRFCQTAL